MVLLNTKLIALVLIGGLSAKAATSLPELYESYNSFEGGEVRLLSALAAEEPEKEEEPAPSEPELVCEEPPEVLLSAIADERELVAQSKKDAEEQMAEVDLARQKLAIEMDQMNELKGTIENLIETVKKAHTSDVDRLITIYSGMKPAEAATIMNNLDLELTVLVLGKMQERKVAPIIAKMDAVRARAISKIIFERSKLPGDQNLTGLKIK